MAGAQGLGDEIYYPEEMQGLFNEFGVSDPNLNRE